MSNNLKIKSPSEIDHIIGNPPSWILRWGLTFLFVAVLLFGALAWMIKYPDVMPAKVVFVTENPAIRVLAQSSGKIEKLVIENNQIVEEGQMIGVLENSASTEDVLILGEFLTKIENSTFSNKKINEQLSLGDLQNGYARLILKIKNYNQFSGQTANAERAISFQKRIENLRKLNSNISNQKSTLKKEMDLAKNNYERNKKLKNLGEISLSELDKAQTVFLQYKRQSENFDNEILNNKVAIAELETQILDLKEVRSTDDSDKKLAISEEIQRLKSDIKS